MSVDFDSLLPEVLAWRGAAQADRRAFTFLRGSRQVETHITYGELDAGARRIAAGLREICAPGDRVLLLYPAGLDYLQAFFGCLYAGVIAVPAYPPDPSRLERTLPRLLGIIDDAGVQTVATIDAIAAMSEGLGQLAPEAAQLRWLATDALTDPAESFQIAPCRPEDIAFLQYTSGSTARPRGVRITHGNLVANAAAIRALAQFRPEVDLGVSWLPLYHDMGLIGNMLQQVFDGYPQVLMSPIDFLKRPASWLQAMSRYEATISAAPNFAFELCASRVTPEERDALDLSRWRLVVCGAEPIRPRTFERFVEAFAPVGFRAEAFQPCYGLAESTLIVSGGAGMRVAHYDESALREDRLQPLEDGYPVVGCGPPLCDLRVAIVDPERCVRCDPDGVGEIWVRGASVADGYWENESATQESFAARIEGEPDAWMRTGDLGFLHAGELYITGRLKDLIIAAGQNHHPHDIEESVVSSDPAFRRGCAAAFTVDAEGTDALVVVAEVRADSEADPEALEREARAAVSLQHGLKLERLVLIAPGTLPKTSSGKLQRRATRGELLANTLTLWSFG